MNKDHTTVRKVDELDAFYASMGDVLKSEPASSNPIFSASAPASQPDSTALTPAPPVPAPELPALPTAAKMDKDQLAGIAAAQAAEQLAKAEEKKKRKAASMISTVGIAGGGLKVCDSRFYQTDNRNLSSFTNLIFVCGIDFKATAKMVYETSGALR